MAAQVTGRVHSVESFGTVDGPGVRFVVFLQGCPMRCLYCHNPDTWDPGGGVPTTVEELLAQYARNEAFYRKGGITVTGGEPLLQIEFVTALFREAKRRGIHTCLDTSGATFRPEDAAALAQFDALCAVTDLVLLDIMLPGEDGLSLLKRLRSDKRTAQVPVIMATAKGSEFDKVHGLDNGADDYIAKPFGMMEMVSRVKAVLRRYKQEDKQSRLTAGELVMEIDKHRVMAGGQEVVLTFKEFELLHKLLERPGQVFTREQLLTDIWGYDFAGETRTVDVHVRTLRLKLGEAGALVETVRGVGYRIGAGYEK